MNQQDLYQRVESAIQEAGYPTKSSESGHASLKEVIDRVFPIVADYVKEKIVVFGIEFQDLGYMFANAYAYRSLPHLLKPYALERGPTEGVYITTLGEALKKNFGRFDRTTTLQNQTRKVYHKRGASGNKYKRGSLIFYSSEKELNRYLRTNARRKTENIKGKEVIVIQCNFERENTS